MIITATLAFESEISPESCSLQVKNHVRKRGHQNIIKLKEWFRLRTWKENENERERGWIQRMRKV